jgi:uncharacterized repeat protein (TIGR01451 family)
MSTTRDLRRVRAHRRGLATFVSFLLLFGFALGASSLTALAKSPKKDPAVSEEAAQPDAAPSEEAASDEAPAEEPSPDAAPVKESPAEETPPAVDTAVDDGSGSSGGGATAAASDDAGSNTENNARKDQSAAAASDVVIQNHGGLHGGDVDLDFVAAGPFTYDHSTGVGTNPPFGFNNRTISKNNGVVESLESGDFQCGDLVTFFTEIVIDPGADGGGTIELDYEFDRSTTGQDGILYTDIIDSSVTVNINDNGNAGLDGNEVATLVAEDTTTDPITGTVEIAGLDPGDTVIVRMSVELDCIPNSNPTGNLLAVIQDARVTESEPDNIPVGNQTVPMKSTGFVAQPSIVITKTCPESAPFGEDITFEITIENNGNEDLENVVVTDSVDGGAAVVVTGFPDELGEGDSFTGDFVYSPTGNENDPLTNVATVTADGVGSQTTVTDTSFECDTDILHEPGIEVTKDCPGTVSVGSDIVYTIEVTNTGNEPLVGVTVTDALLGGDITDEFDFDFTNPFPVDEIATATILFSPSAGAESVTNVVTAAGEGEDSGVEASDTATCGTVILNPSIDVTKSCPAVAGVGDEITYSITVTNDGNEDLTNVTVIDSILGDISASFSDDFDAGQTETAEFPYVVQDTDDDPLVNVVTVTGLRTQSETNVSDVADCTTDILHPGIGIVKTVSDETVPVGTTVTYTYVITNTGDTTLFNVTVDDDVLGHIGDIPVLGPGQSVTMTKDFVVGEAPVVNIAIAEGEDVLGRTVSADDDATVTPIAAANPPTPFTGSDASRLAVIAIGLFGLGATLVAATRRRRTRETA